MPEESQREPFIASQRFLLLETKEHPKQFLNPGDFREARMRAFAKETKEDGILQRVPTSTMDGESWLDAWKPKTRDELLGDSTPFRYCVNTPSFLPLAPLRGEGVGGVSDRLRIRQ